MSLPNSFDYKMHFVRPPISTNSYIYSYFYKLSTIINMHISYYKNIFGYIKQNLILFLLQHGSCNPRVSVEIIITIKSERPNF
ncbi:hypothetical protein Hanom_Chr06g00530661 [Helianthus anomalus]